MRNFLRRLKPTRNPPNLIGWIIIAAGAFSRLMDTVDFVGIMKTAWRFLPSAWMFLTSESGTFVMIVIGLAAIGYGSTLHEKIKIKRRSRDPFDIESEKLADILRTMINTDNGEPARCVLVEPTRVLLDHMKDMSGPYLVFTFRVYNASVHNIKFGKEPIGHVTYEKQELKDELEFLPGG